MKKIAYYLIFGLLVVGCALASKTTHSKAKLPDGAVRIANDSLAYELIIIDSGFDLFLHTLAKPPHFYSQQYYETKNKFYVAEWNRRVTNPSKYNSNIYENIIDYNFNTNYGFDVNYKLYNYFLFVEYKYKQRF